MKDIFQVIDTIQLSEKATLLTETNNEYVFKVNRHANKLEIRQALEKLFGKKDEPASPPQPQSSATSPVEASRVTASPAKPVPQASSLVHSPNRRIRVFISSTFRDMIGERFVETPAALVGERDHAQTIIHLHQTPHLFGKALVA